MRFHRCPRQVLVCAVLVLAATACAGGADGEVSQEGKGGYLWKATDEICNALPYGELADPLGAREEAADRNERPGGGAPGVQCVQLLVETGPARYGNVKIELDLAYAESVGFAEDVFRAVRDEPGRERPDGGTAEVKGVGKEAYRVLHNGPTELRQVRDLHVRDSNLMLDVTVTAEARTAPTPESLKALDASVDDFARGVLKALRKEQ
ncbi:hypothetical protein ACFWUZ_17165 [Streptomyces sp. NPDC058646]|uniref:hypothetical protein n=1 Tax=Streptomyces sp. NPDC058646 TaxID=3346574 RepID=UPI003661D4ED